MEGKLSEGKSSGGDAVRVAQEGNKRVGSMTVSETDQCILDILEWLYDKAPGLDLKGVRGADGATLGQVEKRFDPLPGGVLELLGKHDGAVLLPSFTLLSGADMIKTAEDMAKDHGDSWKASFVPVARDLDDDLLVSEQWKIGREAGRE